MINSDANAKNLEYKFHRNNGKTLAKFTKRLRKFRGNFRNFEES